MGTRTVSLLRMRVREAFSRLGGAHGLTRVPKSSPTDMWDQHLAFGYWTPHVSLNTLSINPALPPRRRTGRETRKFKASAPSPGSHRPRSHCHRATWSPRATPRSPGPPVSLHSPTRGAFTTRARPTVQISNATKAIHKKKKKPAENSKISRTPARRMADDLAGPC